LARRSLKPQLNQIRAWVRQGRTDAWIAHQLDVSVGDIRSFKREHELVPDEPANGDEGVATPSGDEELDLRAEDDARVAAAPGPSSAFPAASSGTSSCSRLKERMSPTDTSSWCAIQASVRPWRTQVRI